MTDESFEQFDPQWTALPGSALPAEQFLRLSEPLVPALGQKLGYFGDARWVMFYWEPRSDSLVWQDGLTYGFGSGTWQVFMDEIAPLADLYEVSLGSGEAEGSHVLLIDRLTQQAWFADRRAARRLLEQQHEPPPMA